MRTADRQDERISYLGLEVKLAGNEVVFSFTNDHIAEEFARLNGQGVNE